MPELIVPTVDLHTEWLVAHGEWGPGVHEDGFGLGPSDETDSPVGFATWVKRLLDESDPAKAIAMGRVPCRYRWIVENGQVLGGIALRYKLIEEFGHIGYGIRPSARGRGLAAWALAQVLTEARAADLERVLLVCEESNTASATTITRLGGLFEGVRETEHGTDLRYWINL